MNECLLREEQKMIGQEGEQSEAMTAHNSFGQKKELYLSLLWETRALKWNC